MIKVLFNTTNSWSPLFVRLLLGIVFFAHGGQKLFGWFGGFGFDASMNYFTVTRNLPWIIGFVIIIIEVLGSLALIVGFATRLWSLGLLFLNLGIVYTSHNQYFFMNWYGSQKEEGYEYFLLAIGMALSLVFSGAGRLSIDRLLSAQTAVSNGMNTTWASEHRQRA